MSTLNENVAPFGMDSDNALTGAETVVDEDCGASIAMKAFAETISTVSERAAPGRVRIKNSINFFILLSSKFNLPECSGQ